MTGHQDRDEFPAAGVCDVRELQRQALQSRDAGDRLHKGMNISDVLDMTVDEAVNFFRACRRFLIRC